MFVCARVCVCVRSPSLCVCGVHVHVCACTRVYVCMHACVYAHAKCSVLR